MDVNPISRRSLPWIGGGLFVAVVTVAIINWPKPMTIGADASDPAQVSLGRSVYSENCASCHGLRLEGQPNWRIRKPDGMLPAPPHDESGHTWHHTDRQLFEITKSGISALVAGYKSDMPVFENVLTDHDIWAVLAFIKSTWSQTVRQRRNRRFKK